MNEFGTNYLDCLFDHAIRTADVLANMFGRHCEVAVHDFRNLDHSLIHLAGCLTNREIGAPITDLVLNVINQSPDHSVVHDLVNYRTTTKSGIEMKSSTIFLRDSDHRIVGAMCINVQINDLRYMHTIIGNFLSFNDSQEHEEESFPTTVQEMVEEMVLRATAEIGVSSTAMTVDEKLSCVAALEKKGVFLIKGAVDFVASTLGISKYTLYSYLQRIRSESVFRST